MEGDKKWRFVVVVVVASLVAAVPAVEGLVEVGCVVCGSALACEVRKAVFQGD